MSDAKIHQSGTTLRSPIGEVTNTDLQNLDYIRHKMNNQSKTSSHEDLSEFDKVPDTEATSSVFL